MAKEFKVPSRRQPIFKFVRKIIGFIKCRGIKVIAKPDNLPNKCILVANHAAKAGPVAYEVGLPIFNVKWGAHEMLGNYRMRRRYLIDIFYVKKQGMNKTKAVIKASFEAIFSKMIYRGMKIIGTYLDYRLRITIKNSIKVLEDDKAVIIFPEDSNNGYFDVMTSFLPGFVMLSEQYYKKNNEDLPIFPVYYHQATQEIVIGDAIYVQDLVKEGKDRKEIAQVYRDAVNHLYFKYFKKEN